MLKYLKIQNFAIINQVEVDFGPGLNIISGETGAGKSIIMDALFLILGGRASADLIRQGAEEASVEALFEVSGDNEILQQMEALGISDEDGDLVIRRIVNTSGKNRIFANGALLNTSSLQSLTRSLVDLCSQNDQQLLSKTEEQLLWIDRFGSLEKEREQVRELHADWRKKKQELDALSTDSTQRSQRIDFLRFQLQELEDAAIEGAEEDKEKELELKTLESAEDLFAFSQEADGLIHGMEGSDSESFLASVGALLNKAKQLKSSDPKLITAMEFLETLKVNLEELDFFLREYSQRINREENKLDELNARLSLLSKLKKKYGPSLSDVLSYRENAKKELSLLENHDSSLSAAQDSLNAARERLESICSKLSNKRKLAAKAFAQAVVQELSELNMERARFQVDLTEIDTPTSFGKDAAKFLISANPGEPLASLNKVASGGELSRVMLAMHNVVSSRGGVGVYLFDEVDAGIGGKTAVTVGSKLQRVASQNQVICITHLPQVAAFADEHFHVEKKVTGKGSDARTFCLVVHLNQEEREQEIARMLGGMDNDKAARANARAMLEKGRTIKIAKKEKKKATANKHSQESRSS